MLKGVELTPELQEILNANMDCVQERRTAREAFKDIQLNIDHILFNVIIFIKVSIFISEYDDFK